MKLLLTWLVGVPALVAAMVLALWLVCHATTLHIASVDFDGREWNSSSSDKGWTSRTSPPGATGEVLARLASAAA